MGQYQNYNEINNTPANTKSEINIFFSTLFSLNKKIPRRTETTTLNFEIEVIIIILLPVIVYDKNKNISPKNNATPII